MKSLNLADRKFTSRVFFFQCSFLSLDDFFVYWQFVRQVWRHCLSAPLFPFCFIFLFFIHSLFFVSFSPSAGVAGPGGGGLLLVLLVPAEAPTQRRRGRC